MKKLIVFAIAIFGFTAVSFGQPGNTATATVGASIITPITISATAMNFGTILAANTGTANVTIAPTGTTTYGTGLSYYSNTGAIATTPATFSVAGNFNNSYGITVTAPVSVVNGAASMAISAWTMGAFSGAGSGSFTAGAGTGTGTLSAGGTETFSIGATLAVTAGQLAGVYTAATPISVTVIYN